MSLVFQKNDQSLFCLDIDGIPSFCGGKVLHNFVFYDACYKLTKRQFVSMANNFREALLGSGKARKEYKLYLNGTENSRGLQTAKMYFADAVFGEDKTEKDPSIYRLCTEVEGYTSSPPTLNPNSWNMVQTFELTRVYEKPEQEEDEDEEVESCEPLVVDIETRYFSVDSCSWSNAGREEA